MQHIICFFKRILFLTSLYAISRIGFFINNSNDSEYQELFFGLLEGLRFDLSAILYINLPIFSLLIFHFFWPSGKSFKRFINILFYGINIPFILLNNIDIAFYNFNDKRLTFDFFNLITYSDFKNVYSDYFVDYWPITLLSLLQVYLITRLKKLPHSPKRSPFSILVLVSSIALIVIGLRGGTQLKPIKPIHAGVVTNHNFPDLVLNTPFSILHSYNQQTIKRLHYVNEIDNTIYSSRHNYQANYMKKENVVVIILESFSKEFVGYYNNGIGYTPFLDSLLQTGLAIENAYANGVRSIEALPAIMASIPSLMNEPFISSPYANNSIKSLAQLLKDENYSTSFFHGGERGTMGFYEYCKKSGFDSYYGRKEFNNDEYYDNNWGIYDGAFFQFFANQLNLFKEPFFSTFFSLTSHPPYQLPKKYQSQFPKGKLQIHESIGYTDFSLKQFFNSIKNTTWFDNTLFVITADHTSPLVYEKSYKNPVDRYAIPLLFWKSDQSLKGSSSTISQHIDIMPTVLDYLNYDQPFYSMGKSIFKNESWAISFLKENHLLITDNCYLRNSEENYYSFADKDFKHKLANQDSAILLLKFIKQTFNSNMIDNQMQIDEN